jgi:hypothetical protein
VGDVSKDTLIIEYTLQQAIADGVLAEVFKNRWKKLTGGKPIVATSHLFNEISLAGLMEIWNEFVVWKRKTEPESSREEIFTTKMNGKEIWLMEDGQAYTMLYPEDY